MESSDLTIIILSANRVPEKWAQFHKEKLIEAAGASPIITIYPKEHFEYRPPLDTFAYNMNRFGLFT